MTSLLIVAALGLIYAGIRTPNQDYAWKLVAAGILCALVAFGGRGHDSKTTAWRASSSFSSGIYKDGQDAAANAAFGGPLPSYSDYGGKNRGPGTGPRFFDSDR